MNSTVTPAAIRNFVLIGQSGAGKTTLAETMLKNDAGPVSAAKKNGEKLIGLEPEEVSHSIIITPHVCYAQWKDKVLNMVDCPGHSNFLETTRAVIPAVDAALFCLPASGEVKFESEKLWSFLREERVPSILFANVFEDETPDLMRFVSSSSESLEIPVVPLALPVVEGGRLRGLICLLESKYLSIDADTIAESAVPAALRPLLDEWRAKLIEKAAECEDNLTEKYINDGTLDDEDLRMGLMMGIRKNEFLPVIFGSALSVSGLQYLLDSIVDLLPSAEERGRMRYFEGFDPGDHATRIVLKGDQQEAFAAIVLKTSIDQFSGKLSFVRVISGHIEPHTTFVNSSRGVKQKSNHLFRAHGKELVAVDTLRAGEIGALAKLDETLTCDTLCDSESQIVFARPRFADALVSYAVEIDSKADEKISTGLSKIAMEDPTLHFTRDPESHELLLGGMGQTHLEISLERLERKFGGHAVLKAPRVPYRETIRRKASAQGKLKKQTGGHGQFANCFLEVEPLARGAGFEFEDAIVGGAIPRQFIPSVEKGVREALRKGVLAGYPVVDFRVKLTDGSYHDVDSSDYAFQVAGSLGLKAALQEAQPVLLEPIMSIEIQVPEDVTGDVVKDISSRRGRILGMVTRGDRQKIQAEAPMAEMLEYGNILNSITSGRGTYSMTLNTYREVPQHFAEKVVATQQQAAAEHH